MNAEAIASVAAVTVVAVQMLKWGLPRLKNGMALAVTAGMSLALCSLWALSGGLPLVRESAYPFAVGWITVMSSAAGVYGFVSRPMRARGGEDA